MNSRHRTGDGVSIGDDRQSKSRVGKGVVRTDHDSVEEGAKPLYLEFEKAPVPNGKECLVSPQAGTPSSGQDGAGNRVPHDPMIGEVAYYCGTNKGVPLMWTTLWYHLID